jgi:hypothetical protein
MMVQSNVPCFFAEWLAFHVLILIWKGYVQRLSFGGWEVWVNIKVVCRFMLILSNSYTRVRRYCHFQTMQIKRKSPSIQFSPSAIISPAIDGRIWLKTLPSWQFGQLQNNRAVEINFHTNWLDTDLQATEHWPIVYPEVSISSRTMIIIPKGFKRPYTATVPLTSAAWVARPKCPRMRLELSCRMSVITPHLLILHQRFECV